MPLGTTQNRQVVNGFPERLREAILVRGWTVSTEGGKQGLELKA